MKLCHLWEINGPGKLHANQNNQNNKVMFLVFFLSYMKSRKKNGINKRMEISPKQKKGGVEVSGREDEMEKSGS